MKLKILLIFLIIGSILTNKSKPHKKEKKTKTKEKHDKKNEDEEEEIVYTIEEK